MQAAMDRLDGFTRKHGKLVALAWLARILAAIPFASRQTEHLTSGGFEVPGSGSAAVERGLGAFHHAQRSQLAVVVARRPGSSDADVRAAIARVRAAAAKTDHVALPAHAAEAPGRGAFTVLPLRLSGSQDAAANAATGLRRELDLKAGTRGHVALHLVGQQALWAGMQDLAKHDREQAEKVGFPIVLLILLAVF